MGNASCSTVITATTSARHTIGTSKPAISNFLTVSMRSYGFWSIRRVAGISPTTSERSFGTIREQRSRFEKAKRTEAATEARRHPDVSSKTADTKPKADTRADLAKEAKLPENELKVAQRLKKYQLDLYKNVLAGTATLRDTNKLLRSAAAEDLRKRYSEKDFYNRVGRNLSKLYKYNQLDERLKELMNIKNLTGAPWLKKESGDCSITLLKSPNRQGSTSRCCGQS